MKSVRLLSAALLTSVGLVAVGATTEAANAANSKDLSVSYSKVIKDEVFAAYGRVSPHIGREVRLQSRIDKHHSWKTIATTLSDASGNFEFGASATKTRYFRYYAPVNVLSPKILGNSTKVSVVSQSVKFFAVTPDFQCSNASTIRDVTMLAQFYPIRSGRMVQFTTNKGVQSSFEDGNGIASITFAPGTSEFSVNAKATVLAEEGAAAKSSAVRNYTESFCNF